MSKVEANMTEYDLIFITNVPAFYKINLYNKLSEVQRVKVIFISKTSKIRVGNFTDAVMNFDYHFVCDCDYEARNKIATALKIFNILRKVRYQTLVYPGWELVELIPFITFHNHEKNAMVIESSILESKTSGLVWIIKKYLIKRMSLIFPSGCLQNEILKKAGFKGTVKYTYGVGLPIRKKRRLKNEINDSKVNKYLYVGRVAPEKNLEFLIDEFNINGKSLTIVGDGELYSKCKSMANQNIQFTGYIDNDKLPEIYLSHDVFILPSKSEAWGLVVEEALWAGLPVIVSSNVGCYEDLVIETGAGIVFKTNDSDSFNSALKGVESSFKQYRKKALLIDFEERDRRQVDAYITSCGSSKVD